MKASGPRSPRRGGAYTEAVGGPPPPRTNVKVCQQELFPFSTTCFASSVLWLFVSAGVAGAALIHPEGPLRDPPAPSVDFSLKTLCIPFFNSCFSHLPALDPVPSSSLQPICPVFCFFSPLVSQSNAVDQPLCHAARNVWFDLFKFQILEKSLNL